MEDFNEIIGDNDLPNSTEQARDEVSDAQAPAALVVQITEYSATAAALGKLRSKYEKVLFPVTTTAGMKDAKGARSELTNLRVGLEKMRKDIKAPELERCRLIDAEAKTITAALVALEDPIDAQIKAQEQKLAAEKAERDRKEAERKAGLQANVDAIRNLHLGMIDDTAADIETEIEALRQFHPGDDFMEFAGAATEAANVAIAAMTALHERQVAKEAQAAELERQRVENARIAAEQEVERQRMAVVAEQQAAQLKAEQDRFAAEQKAAADRAAAELAERERVAAETKRQLEEQQAAIAAERAAIQAERDALAAEKLAAAEAEAQRVIDSTPKVEYSPMTTEQAGLPTHEVEPLLPQTVPDDIKTHKDGEFFGGIVTDELLGISAVQEHPTEAEDPPAPPTLRLGQISERLGMTVTADLLLSIGFAHSATDKAAKLYHEREFGPICDALIARIQAAKEAAK